MRKRLFITVVVIAQVCVCCLAQSQEKIILLNEGMWQADNGRITYFENGEIVSNQWFRDKNGYKIGDTPNDIIQINDNLIAIAINWSNIVQFIKPDGTAVAAIEDIPNNRKLCSDGSYVYVTSYGHECGTVDGTKTFTKGFVAKIDLSTFKVVSATEVGYEPEGIALYKGHLFIANTGGYADEEKDHDFETTVSIVNTESMQVVKTIDTHVPNLFGEMSRSGQYLLINSPGDYYEQPVAGMVFDCEKALNGDGAGYAGFLKVADEFSSTDAGNLANLYAGLCYAQLGKWTEAAKYLEEYDAQDDKMISPAAEGALGNAYAHLNQLDKAVNHLKNAAKKADNNSLSPTFLIQAGEILESQGKTAEALELYKEVKTKYFYSMQYQTIDKYIERASK